MHTVDTDLSKLMIKLYQNNESKFEWMDIFKKKKRNITQMKEYNEYNLYDQLRFIDGNQYQVCKVSMFKDYKSENLTDLILHEKQDGLFVAILSDKDGNRSHAVGIDAGNQLIYDCMEDKQLQLNEDNLSICCGINKEFHRIELACELQKKRQKNYNLFQCQI